MAAIFDTIVAVVTGTVPSAVAIVRLSGAESAAVAKRVFPRDLPSDLRLVYGRFVTGEDGYAVHFPAGRSYTGENSVELMVHGSAAGLAALLHECLVAGARAARPGEFTERAFLNGRIDLTQAEAVRDTIEAQTRAQLKRANSHREGSLSVRVGEVCDRLSGLLAAVEASTDFSEDIGELDSAMAADQLDLATSELQKILDTARSGRLMRQGLRIAIVGRPNVGKSSLLNAWVGTHRALVSSLAGTTRDYVEEVVEFEGVPLVLIDTAGLRETDDPVESMGVQLARERLETADLVWHLYDVSEGWTKADEAVATSLPTVTEVWRVPNKCDLVPLTGGIHTQSPDGLEALRVRLRSYLPSHREEMSLDPRHTPYAQEALEAIQASQAAVRHDLPSDLLATTLREALQALGRITGETADEDMLSRIFRDFCLGK